MQQELFVPGLYKGLSLIQRKNIWFAAFSIEKVAFTIVKCKCCLRTKTIVDIGKRSDDEISHY